MSAYSVVKRLREEAAEGAANLSSKIEAGLICADCHQDLDTGGECDSCDAEFDYGRAQ